MLVDEFLIRLEGAQRRLSSVSYREELDALGDDAARRIGGNFSREESSTGAVWPEHAPATVALYGKHPLLRLSYDMFHAAVDPDDNNAVKNLTDREIEFGVDGTRLPYARIQNEGGGNIPQREYFYLREVDLNEVVERFTERAMGKFTEAIIG